jgi:hypothetical protein
MDLTVLDIKAWDTRLRGHSANFHPLQPYRVPKKGLLDLGNGTLCVLYAALPDEDVRICPIEIRSKYIKTNEVENVVYLYDNKNCFGMLDLHKYTENWYLRVIIA